jgi:hypothetical protein
MSEAIWPLYNTLKLYFCIRSTKDKSIAFLACINALAKAFAYFFCFDPVYKKKSSDIVNDLEGNSFHVGRHTTTR